MCTKLFYIEEFMRFVICLNIQIFFSFRLKQNKIQQKSLQLFAKFELPLERALREEVPHSFRQTLSF
jgi:hypothetical protein